MRKVMVDNWFIEDVLVELNTSTHKYHINYFKLLTGRKLSQNAISGKTVRENKMPFSLFIV